MNFPGKINNLTLILIISSPQQFHIVNVQCTKQNQKKSSEKNHLGESVVIHMQPVSKLSQPCLGSTGENGRKRERKNHEFSCVLENLPYSKFNMYPHGWVLTFNIHTEKYSPKSYVVNFRSQISSSQSEERTMVFTREKNQKPQRCVSFAPKFPPFIGACSAASHTFNEKNFTQRVFLAKK